jgi:hypothetical protein
MSYVRCHKDPYAFRIGHLQTGQRAYSRPLCAIATSVAVASTRHPQPLSLSASCSTSIHVQARQGRHDEARKQARLSCCAVVSSWLRCVWRVGALSHTRTRTPTRSHHSQLQAPACRKYHRRPPKRLPSPKQPTHVRVGRGLSMLYHCAASHC